MSRMKRDEPVIIIKKKGGKHDDYHGGSWKVAYADFVTAMMAFFLVMWIMGMDEGVRDMVQGYFNDPLGSFDQSPSSLLMMYDGTPGRDGSPDVGGTGLLAQYGIFTGLAQAIRSGFSETGFEDMEVEVEVSVSEEGLRIELMETSGEDVFFQTGSAQVRPALDAAMNIIGRELKVLRHPMVVEGHTDARPFAGETDYGNWELSVDRANAVRRTLMAASEGQIRVHEVRGYADQLLRNPDDPEAPQNRRVSLLIPFLSGFLDDVDPWDGDEHDGDGPWDARNESWPSPALLDTPQDQLPLSPGP